MSSSAVLFCFGTGKPFKKVWIPKDIKTIDSSAFSNSMENLTIYGEAQSAAAHYASENLLDFVVLGKNEFKNVASAATATEKMTLGDSVESDGRYHSTPHIHSGAASTIRQAENRRKRHYKTATN